MSECGEDLLVDLSEILFNELAFFRLMQNLDTTNTKVKERLRTFAKVTVVHHSFVIAGKDPAYSGPSAEALC